MEYGAKPEALRSRPWGGRAAFLHPQLSKRHRRSPKDNVECGGKAEALRGRHAAFVLTAFIRPQAQLANPKRRRARPGPRSAAALLRLPDEFRKNQRYFPVSG